MENIFGSPCTMCHLPCVRKKCWRFYLFSFSSTSSFMMSNSWDIETDCHQVMNFIGFCITLLCANFNFYFILCVSMFTQPHCISVYISVLKCNTKWVQIWTLFELGSKTPNTNQINRKRMINEGKHYYYLRNGYGLNK